MKNIETMHQTPITTIGINPPEKSKTGQFYDDVITGLSAAPKYLNSKYFYDAVGDKLFQDLMSCDEYYPTNCELEFFSKKTADLCKEIMGAGDAIFALHRSAFFSEKISS